MDKRVILGIDFDMTIAVSEFPVILGLVKDAKEYINKLYDEGYYIIIWTCRSDDAVLEAEIFLLEQGIKFHKINEHEPSGRLKYKNNTRKIYAHYYIDDRNVGGLMPWKDIYAWLSKQDKSKLE